MILCLDAGNTRVKWGVHDGNGWLHQQVTDYTDLASLSAVLPYQVQHFLACNVAGMAVQQRIERIAQQLAVPLNFFQSTVACCGVKNNYSQPTQLGADRWAGLIAARALLISSEPEAAIVVQSGTATTVDFLDAAGVFQGGLILPGLQLMHQSLTHHAAGLRDIAGALDGLDLSRPAKNTQDAMASGALYATLGAIERMRRIHCATQCVLSGGAAGYLAPHLSTPALVVDYLVLEGLRAVAESTGID